MPYRHLTSVLRKVADAPGFRLVFKRHAELRMRQRDATRLEVERVLRAGRRRYRDRA